MERAALAHRRTAAHGGGLAGLRRNGGPGHGFGSRLAGKRAGAVENSSRGSGRGAEDRRAVLAGGAARRINDERLRARGAARERRKSGQRGSLPCSGAPAVACGTRKERGGGSSGGAENSTKAALGLGFRTRGGGGFEEGFKGVARHLNRAGTRPRRAGHARRGEARAGAADGLEPESGSRWGTRLMGGPHASATEGGGGARAGPGRGTGPAVGFLGRGERINKGEGERRGGPAGLKRRRG